MKSFVAMSLAAAALCLAPPALATHVSCGQRITTDTVLDSDLDCPAGNGIEIAASGVDLDLTGHTRAAGETDFLQVITSGSGSIPEPPSDLLGDLGAQTAT